MTEAEGEVHDLVKRLNGVIRAGEQASAGRRWLFEQVGGEATPTLEPRGRRAEPPETERLHRLLDVDAAADYVGVHRNTIYEAARLGDLVVRRVGRLVRFTIDDLDRWTGKP